MASNGAPAIRGMYTHDEEAPGSGFENGIPSFGGENAKADAVAWIERHRHRGSNPEYPHLRHVISHLVDWDQIDTYLVSKLHEHRLKQNPGGRARPVLPDLRGGGVRENET